MNQKDGEHWKSKVLDEVFVALAASKPLEEALIFKGARVLNIRLGNGRQSLDLDSNLAESFVRSCPDREAQIRFLELEMSRAVRRHFEQQEPVLYQLTSLRIKTYPHKSHPMGWDAFKVRMNVKDLSKHVSSLPALDLDIAAHEELLESSVTPLKVGGHRVWAYSLERIAGEKLRAFLSSLPNYRAKMKKPGDAVRAKDLYDISRIHGVHDLSQVNFWQLAGKEFIIACRSRYIDCLGLTTFQEQWDVTRSTYQEATIPKDIPFVEAETILVKVVRFFEEQKIVPFTFPLPNG